MMEYPGRGKDDQKIYWSTSASVRANQPFLVSSVHRSSQPGTPERVSFSFDIDQKAIKIEEISCKLNINPQVRSPDIISLPSHLSEKTNGMQESFGASPAICNGSAASEIIHGDQIMEADPMPLNCIENESACIPAPLSSTELVTAKRLGCCPFCSDTLNCYTTSTRKKKPNLFKKLVSCFYPFPTPDLVAAGPCQSRPRCKKS